MSKFDSILSAISTHDVVLYMKGTPQYPRCGFSAMVVQILGETGVRQFESVDTLADTESGEAIKEFKPWPTIPQLYVKGEFVGGFDIVNEMFRKGELSEFFISKGINLR